MKVKFSKMTPEGKMTLRLKNNTQHIFLGDVLEGKKGGPWKVVDIDEGAGDLGRSIFHLEPASSRSVPFAVDEKLTLTHPEFTAVDVVGSGGAKGDVPQGFITYLLRGLEDTYGESLELEDVNILPCWDGCILAVRIKGVPDTEFPGSALVRPIRATFAAHVHPWAMPIIEVCRKTLLDMQGLGRARLCTVDAALRSIESSPKFLTSVTHYRSNIVR